MANLNRQAPPSSITAVSAPVVVSPSLSSRYDYVASRSSQIDLLQNGQIWWNNGLTRR